MLAFPPCKINLGLRVVDKRNDGYHNIDTCFYPVLWNDILEIIPAPETSITFSGIDIPGKATSNIVLKAYNLLKVAYGIGPVKIHLHKIIPHSAGLGGGSSDGAYALKILDEIFQLRLSDERLRAFALKLGSDCPFFIDPRPMLAWGRGEILRSLSLKLSGYTLVIVKPSLSVSTEEAYEGIKPLKPVRALEFILAESISKWPDALVNDFEEPVFKKYPLIKDIKTKLYNAGAVYACMSGSGSAVFGLFEKSIPVTGLFSDCTVWQGQL